MMRNRGQTDGLCHPAGRIPPDIPADQALNDNTKYQVVWQILNALRSHDERLDAVINQGGLGQDVSDRIAIVDGRSLADSEELQAVTATVEELPGRQRKGGPGIGAGGGDGNRPPAGSSGVRDRRVLQRRMAKIVEKCGTRDYWEDWARTSR